MSGKLSYVNGTSTVSMLGETIGHNLKNTTHRYPYNDALVCVSQNYRATYAEFYEQTAQVAKSLLAKGIAAGERVGIWSPNRHEWVLLQYATARIGVILVNINPAYRATEVEYVINQSGIRLIVSALSFKTSNYRDMLEKVSDSCPTLTDTIYLDADWNKFLTLSDQITDEALAACEANVKFDDPVNIQYTSGTTGFPKGVTLSHHNLLNNGYFIGVRLHYTHVDRVCIPVPFYHCFGMVIGNLCCTAHGACMVIPAESFDPALTLQAVQDERCTSLYGVPTMFIAELNLHDFDRYDLRSLRTGVMAGSPCPAEIMKQVHAKMHMHEVSVCYGMTETSPVSVQTIIGAPLEKQVSTAGTVHDHLEIKIIDSETGRVLPRGMAGELCTRGYSVMLKYWNNEEATRGVIDEGRWMHTGDLAIMDEDDYIEISGRIKDVIIRGGENISPKELEDFLYKHDDIEDVQIIGVPDEKYGEQIMAWVKLKENSPADAQSLTDYCNNKIAHYKIPKYWKFVDSFPITITGKIRKNEMREISVIELGLDKEREKG